MGRKDENPFLPKQSFPGLKQYGENLTVLLEACARLRIPSGLGLGSLLMT